MIKKDELERKLAAHAGWRLVNNKKAIVDSLSKILGPEESIHTLTDGLFSGGKITGDGEAAGLLLLAGNRIVFVTGEGKSRYEEIPLEHIVGITRGKVSSFYELMIRTRSSMLRFKTFSGTSSAKEFIDAVEGGGAALTPYRRGETEKLLNEIQQSYDALTKMNRDLLGEIETGGESAPAETSGGSDFLFREAAEIRRVLTQYLEMKSAIVPGESIRNDMILLTALFAARDGVMPAATAAFIAMVLVPVLERDNPAYADLSEKITGSDSYPREHTKDLAGYMKALNSRLSKMEAKPDFDGSSLLSMNHLRRYDLDNGTDHADRLGTAYYNYCQCIAKADGTIDRKEEGLLREIHDCIFFRDAAAPAADTVPEEETLGEIMEKINRLVGMKEIKEAISTMVNLIKVQKRREELKLPATPVALHSVFYGPPGTGKTTIARLLGRLYRALGILKKGHLIETDRAGLVAGYVGQTAINVDEVVKKALDGVLFIDEAYALVPERGGSDFGMEAIDTILKRMEDYRDRLVVIVAGYTDEMEKFISSNPGLKSRFSRYFYFDHYKPEELFQIFELFCANASLNLDDNAKEGLRGLLAALHMKRDRSFGNGRLVRNIFEKTVERQADRIAGITPLTGEVLCSLTGEDIPREENTVSPMTFDK